MMTMSKVNDAERTTKTAGAAVAARMLSNEQNNN